MLETLLGGVLMLIGVMIGFGMAVKTEEKEK